MVQNPHLFDIIVAHMYNYKKVKFLMNIIIYLLLRFKLTHLCSVFHPRICGTEINCGDGSVISTDDTTGNSSN